MGELNGAARSAQPSEVSTGKKEAPASRSFLARAAGNAFGIVGYGAEIRSSATLKMWPCL